MADSGLSASGEPIPVGDIILIIGPMFGGKSSELIRQAEKFALCGRRCVIIHPVRDTRRKKGTVFTHRDGSRPFPESLREHIDLLVVNTLEEADHHVLGTADFVGIDEGQFFPDLAKTCRKWADAGVMVAIAALNGKAKVEGKRGTWDAVSEILPEATDVIFQKAVCASCRHPKAAATYSVLRRGDLDEHGEKIGGGEYYAAMCPSCAADPSCADP